VLIIETEVVQYLAFCGELPLEESMELSSWRLCDDDDDDDDNNNNNNNNENTDGNNDDGDIHRNQILK
jgi:hypothetical protein